MAEQLGKILEDEIRKIVRDELDKNKSTQDEIKKYEPLVDNQEPKSPWPWIQPSTQPYVPGKDIYPGTSPTPYRCIVCGIDLSKTMMYCCYNPRCPSFPRYLLSE